MQTSDSLPSSGTFLVSRRSMQEAAAAELHRMSRQATTARPLEAALQLQQRLRGSNMEEGPFPALAKRLAHQFPLSPPAYPLLGMLLHGRLLAGGQEPSTAGQRAHLIQASILMKDRREITRCGASLVSTQASLVFCGVRFLCVLQSKCKQLCQCPVAW